MEIFKVKGSKGNIYKITKDGDNYNCECKSFYYNKYTCKQRNALVVKLVDTKDLKSKGFTK